jgi:DNA polymerase-1
MSNSLVIDGNSLVYRCYYASYKQLEYYKQVNKTPLNAVKLFLLIIVKIINSKNYQYLLIAFDHSKKTLRHTEFAAYKEGRKPMPEDLVVQLPLINQALDLLGVKYLSQEGYEADDIIGSYAKLMNDHNIAVDIYSTDKDMLQLVNELTSVKMFKTGVSETIDVNINNFHEVFFGLTPAQVCDFKGISGDSSDNLSGVKGIGPKTARELIKKYHSLEGIYENINLLSKNHQDKFNASKAHAFMCKNLSIIDVNMVKIANIDEFKNNYSLVGLRAIIDQYHFQGFEKYFNS